MGAFVWTCFPSRAPQQRGKFQRSWNPSVTDRHSPVEGTAMKSSTRQSQMAVATWGLIWHTVDTPTLKLNAMVLQESPVTRNLDKIVQN